MLQLTGRGQAHTCDGLTRRDFLQAGVLGAVGFSLVDYAALKSRGAVSKDADERAVIMIFNLGAPSQLDTFDMKPDAPSRNPRPLQADSHRVFRDRADARFCPSTPGWRTNSQSCEVAITRRPPSTTRATR